MFEKRKIKRNHLIYYLAVFDRNTDDLAGYLGDITTEGAQVLSESPLVKDHVYNMKIELQSTVYGSKNIEFDALCVRSEKDVNPNLYNNGFQFQAIAPENVAEIDTLISKFGFED